MLKLKFKDDVEVRTLEGLRKNFDLEKAVEYFKSGELLTWLEERFYDNEADAISKIRAGDDNFIAKICAALNVECKYNLEFMRRLREKKSLLAKMTDDEQIIDNAAATAFDQEDLGELIQMGYKTIYLCGEQFNVPIRVADMKYIGILGTPKIKIRAQARNELDDKKISFENCKLPFAEKTLIDELKALAEKIFQTDGKFPIIRKKVSLKRGDNKNFFDQLNSAEKAVAVNMCCQGKYKESEIIFMMFTSDISDGFALTVDSFCTGGASGGYVFKYNEIKKVETNLAIYLKNGGGIDFGHDYDSMLRFNYDLNEKIKKFLDVVKNF